ncbi:Hypothetical protein, putative, partial [Bodo saltans]
VCSGRGLCDAFHGTCSCDNGYTGHACSLRCGDYCHNGVCEHTASSSSSALTCHCHQSESLGYWDGPECSVCLYGFAGPRCNVKCPLNVENGLPCGGRGQCDAIGVAMAATCDCSINPSGIAGRWAGDTCASCAPGYFGAECQLTCPRGSSCSPCSGHGACFDGVHGNGTCACAASSTLGYWAESTFCATCAPGYYGALCQSLCPLYQAVVCAGHGACNEGIEGDGQCMCSVGFSGHDCATCAPGTYGANCTACPTLVLWNPCSGHGTCSEGIEGSGHCVCTLGYGGHHCGFVCPISGNTTCGLSGACVGNGICVCAAPTAIGEDGACSSCISGYWGSTCSHVCPGGPLFPCSGHGSCNPASGTCACHSSAALGYYTGPSCNECSSRYRSPHCNITCPVDPVMGLPCSGRGTCWAGVCSSCARTSNDSMNILVVCGAACEKTNAQCTGAAHSCPTGYYSTDCTLLCPGATVAEPTKACSAHGACNSDNGTCVCSRGYWGDACSGTCPGGAASPCSNRGECSTDTGVCTCDGTAYGLACEYPCPGGYDDPCSGSGVCGPTGACACFASAALGFFAGAACDRCAPYYSGDACKKKKTTPAPAAACAGRPVRARALRALPLASSLGQCVTAARRTTAVTPATVSCDPRTGVVVGKSCVCAAGFVGADCSLACPLSDDDGAVCSGRGTCRAAASGTYAECVCQSDYYSVACSVYCTAAACASSFGFKHAQCNATTGSCECQDNNAGHFAGATCDDCATLYWGAECDRACPCNGRGSCNRYSPTCACFAGTAGSGHYGGTTCSVCADGYIGVDCAILNTEFSIASISTPSDVTVQQGAAMMASYPTSSAVLFRDAEYNVLYSGSTAVAAFASESWSHGALEYLGRVVVDSNQVGSIGILNLTHILVRTVRLVNSDAMRSNVSERNFSASSELFTFPRGSHLWPPTGPGVVTATPLALANNASHRSLQHQRHRRSTTHRANVALASPTDINVTLAAYDVVSDVFVSVAVDSTTDSSTAHIHHPSDPADNTEIIANVEGIATFVGFANISLLVAGSNRGKPVVVLATMRSIASSPWWFAIYFIDPTTGDIVASRLSTELVGSSDVCDHTSTSSAVLCPFVTYCIASSPILDVLLCAVSVYATDHTLLVSLPLSNVTNGGPAQLLEVPEGGNVSCAVFDELDGCALFAMAPFDPSTATSLYRVRIVQPSKALSLVSQLRFSLTGAAYPVVQQMVVNGTSRSLFASLMTSVSASDLAASTASVQHINLFGVWKIDPHVIDRSGGMMVTYIGTGFIPNPPPTCVFHDDAGATTSSDPALFGDGGTVYCNATISVAVDTICALATVDLRYANRTTSTTLVTVLRPLSATVHAAFTPKPTTKDDKVVFVVAHSPHLVSSAITVTGYGFVAGATTAACRHESANGSIVFFTTPNVTFINTTAIVCLQPEDILPTPPGSVLRYSHDGFVFSPSFAPLVVVGDVSGVQVALMGKDPTTSLSILTAALTTQVSPILVQTTDVLGNLLGALDSTTLVARCSLTSPELLADPAPYQHAVSNQTSLRRLTQSGTAIFDDIELLSPTTGMVSIYCFLTVNMTSFGEVPFTIVPGVPTSLRMVSPSSGWRSGVINALTLDPPPKIAVSDSAGNAISDFHHLPITMSLAYTNTKGTATNHQVHLVSSVAADGTYT